MSKPIIALGARKRGISALLELARHLHTLNHLPVVDRVTQKNVGAQLCRAEKIRLREIGTRSKPLLAIALGGDGSFIQHAARFAPLGVPLIGVNLGKVGFLADIPASNMLTHITAVLEGNYLDEQRVMLEVVLKRGGKRYLRQTVINDMVIDRGTAGTVIDIDVQVGRRHSIRLRGDGVIFATPGGSTAYNMAAGGPIVTPDSNCICMTPLSPYSLNHRPLVFSTTHQFSISVAHPSRLMLDGQDISDLRVGDSVLLRTHRRTMTVRHPRDYDYFATLHDKLYWRNF